MPLISTKGAYGISIRTVLPPCDQMHYNYGINYKFVFAFLVATVAKIVHETS